MSFYVCFIAMFYHDGIWHNKNPENNAKNYFHISIEFANKNNTNCMNLPSCCITSF